MQGLSIAIVIWKNIVDQSWHLSLRHMPQEIQRQMPKLLHSGGESNQWVTWRAKLVPSGEGRELRCKGFPDHMTLQQNGSYSSLDLFSRKKTMCHLTRDFSKDQVLRPLMFAVLGPQYGEVHGCRGDKDDSYKGAVCECSIPDRLWDGKLMDFAGPSVDSPRVLGWFSRLMMTYDDLCSKDYLKPCNHCTGCTGPSMVDPCWPNLTQLQSYVWRSTQLWCCGCNSMACWKTLRCGDGSNHVKPKNDSAVMCCAFFKIHSP